MNLNEFFEYKNFLMKLLCSDEAVVRLMTASEEAAVPNHTLPYTQIFPYEFVPETVDKATTFICFDVDIVDVMNRTYYNPVLYIWIFTHASKLHMEEGGVLTDQICVAVNRLLNGNRLFGLGRLSLKSVTRFVPIQDYQGRCMVFTATDFNRPYSKNRVPSNRREDR